MLEDLQRQFLIECIKYNVLPLDDRQVERFSSDLAGRPTLIQGTSLIVALQRHGTTRGKRRLESEK